MTATIKGCKLVNLANQSKDRCLPTA